MPPDDKPMKDNVQYSSGRTKHMGFRLDGEMHGASSWYRTNGSIMRTGEFDRGRQIGTWRTYDRNGTVLQETTFSE